ncbi:hypothetical protein [Staphylococcus sp. Marseille-Q1834]|uniref:hypothetical protein n=1 Tax=Staphylococcus sp. Marseille-Q1834 TaxID=2866594 RepID=UPI0012B91302|nr:hypothetical protein [Staphylococcus sp. Marseille-Q1834]
MDKILSFLIIMWMSTIGLLKFLYAHFSFPLLILLVILIFYPQIKNILMDLKKFTFNWKDTTLVFEREKNETINDLNNLVKLKISEEGKSLLYEGHRGGPLKYPNKKDYLYKGELTINKDFFMHEVKKEGKLHVVNELYNWYEINRNQHYNDNFRGAILEENNPVNINADRAIKRFYLLCNDVDDIDDFINLDDIDNYRIAIFTFTDTIEAMTKYAQQMGT